MRAIIRCYSKATKEQWVQVLRRCEWWSSLPQNDDVVTTQYDQISSLIADEDRLLVRRTYWFMIYNSDVKSWGLVNSPQEYVLEFRIRNHSSAQLRKACEHFISAVMSYSPKEGNPGGLEFEFSENIEVLEANSQHLAFYCEVLPPKKWELARNERRQDWKLAKWSLCATRF